jgi:nitric oxide reductase subunit C
MFPEKKKFVIFSILCTGFLFYTSYLYSHLPAPTTSMSSSEAKGKSLWQSHNCTACHQIYGLGGYLGPDLTNEYSVRGPAFIQVFLQNGNTTMPNYHLTATEIQELIDYLKSVDITGKADPRKFTINNNGTIHQ